MTDPRPVILGMNDPYSADPRHALFPHPPCSAGYRIWALLNRRTGATRGQYVRAFDRRNVIAGPWVLRVAQMHFDVLRPGLQGRTVLLLGQEVRQAAGVPEELVHPIVLDGVTYRQLPHPSGLCRWYNDPVCADLAAMVLEEMYEGWRTRK